MSIFASPPKEESVGLKVLYLHGLNGSPAGSKAKKIKESWNASCPPIRTAAVRELLDKHIGFEWKDISAQEKEAALTQGVGDAHDAMSYAKPDIVVASSMSGAILYKLIQEKKVSSDQKCVFLAPAINELLDSRDFEDINLPNSVWIFSEFDDRISNSLNLEFAKKSGGQIIFSSGDTHRLHKASQTGLIHNSMVTTIELEQYSL